MPSARSTSIARRLHHIVELRRLAAALDSAERDAAWRIARDLRLELGDSVPKLAVADALGISVKALDKWVAKGDVPTLRPPGSKRSRVDTDAAVDLLEEVVALRAAGTVSGVIALGIARLRERGRVRPKLRPNRDASELAAAYRATEPLERLRVAAGLSHDQTQLAFLGARR